MNRKIVQWIIVVSCQLTFIRKIHQIAYVHAHKREKKIHNSSIQFKSQINDMAWEYLQSHYNAVHLLFEF